MLFVLDGRTGTRGPGTKHRRRGRQGVTSWTAQTAVTKGYDGEVRKWEPAAKAEWERADEQERNSGFREGRSKKASQNILRKILGEPNKLQPRRSVSKCLLES